MAISCGLVLCNILHISNMLGGFIGGYAQYAVSLSDEGISDITGYVLT